MKLFLDATWEDFVTDVESNADGITLFGASSCGSVFLEQVNRKFQIKHIIDNDKNKWGKAKQFQNILVEGIEALKEDGEDSILLITSTWYMEIVEQLKQFGYPGKVYSFLNLRKVLAGFSEPERIMQFEHNLEQLKALLADEESKRVVDAILEKRKKNHLDYSDIHAGRQYFISDIIPIRNDAVYVDGGVYNGNTVRDFIEFQNNQFDKVYAFEMDKDNYEMIDFSAFDERVEFLNYGLWNEKGEISYIAFGTASSMSEMGNKTAKVISLDEVLEGRRVTLLKMDIEGAEMEALKGAEQIIKKWHPDCAISIYHKPEDIWEIPFLLHSMEEEYSFYIRHHSNTIHETVLYAVVK